MLSRASAGAILTLTMAAAITLPAGTGKGQVATGSGGGQIVFPLSSVANPADAGVSANTNVEVMVPAGSPTGSMGPQGSTASPPYPPFPGYLFETPASVACAYRFVKPASGCNPNIVTTNPAGGSNAIAIVDAYDTSATAASDLNTFINQFGLSTANFQVIYQNAGSCVSGGTPPPSSAGTGWDLETALDIEWAHAMAPSAKLYLVEANSNSLANLYAAEAIATQCVQANAAGQVSNSWLASAGEYPSELAVDSLFTGAGVMYFFAAGDHPEVYYPAASPNVIGVGGTTFSRDLTTGDFQGELPWNELGQFGTGGGPSAYEARPAYQNAIAAVVESSRGTPDLGAIADPYTGVWIYSTTYCSGWCIVGGTSVATPVVAGISNLTGFFRQSSYAALTEIYANAARGRLETYVTNIDTGACGERANYNPPYIKRTTHISWNWCTGWGTPHGRYYLQQDAAETD
jgi:kumamolisin